MKDQDQQWTDWASELSHWTVWLQDRLSLNIEAWTHRDELNDSLWICIDTHGTVARPFDWIKVIEAIELLDWLSYIDNHSCWDLLLHLIDFNHTFRSKGCPNEYFYGLRPRYEMNFKACSVPTSQAMQYIVHAIADQDRSDEYKAWAIRRPLQTTIPYSSPVQLRFFFDFQFSSWNRCQRCTDRHLTMKLPAEILELATITSSTDSAKRPEFSVVAFGFSTGTSIESNELRDFYRSVGRRIPLFNIQITAPRTDRNTNFYGSFLWRMHVPQTSPPCPLSLMCHPTVTYRMTKQSHFIATFSALAHNQTLRSFVASYDMSRSDYATFWIAFALFSSTATHDIHKVELHLNSMWKTFYSDLRELIHHKNPALHAAYRRDIPRQRVVIDRDATIVRVHAKTKIFGTAFDATIAANTVYHGQGDASCHVVGRDSESVEVLIPGVGFARVRRQDVIEESPTARRVNNPIRSMTITYGEQDKKWVILTLKLLGGDLTTLRLKWDGNLSKSPLPLMKIFAACPNLKHLELFRHTIQPETLFPSRWGRALETIRLVAGSVLPRINRLNFFKPCITPRMAPVLHSVSIDCVQMKGHAAGLHDYLIELATTRHLERFVIAHRESESDVHDKYKALFAVQDGLTMPSLPMRDKLAFLSVVVVGPSKSRAVRFQLNEDTIALIFKFAAQFIPRRVATFVTS